MKQALPLIALALAACAHAEPAPPAARAAGPASPGVTAPTTRLPTDVRRATIIVRDIEASLQLYRDVIGLAVNYDTMVTTGGVLSATNSVTALATLTETALEAEELPAAS